MTEANRRHHRTGRISRIILAGAAAVGLAGGLSLIGATAASASPSQVTNASFTWGLDDTANGGAFYGGCNFLSAGTAGDNGSSALWTQTAPSPGYSTQSGNVTIEYPDAAGTSYSQPTWATKCDDPSGNPLTTSTYSGGEVVFANGTGTVDPAANTASVTWDGSFTSVFYGGLVYWSAVNPTLTVNADGTGTLTASVSGYAASMSNPDEWSAIPASTITLANLSGITVTDSGFTVTPDYVGVAYTAPAGDTAQAAETSDNEAYWGSWPQDFVDFQQQTGESSYWYTSGLDDQAKVADPITFAYTATTPPPTGTAPTVTTQPTDQTATVGGNATFTAAASGDPTPTVQWQLEAPGSSDWQDYPGATDTTFVLPVYAAGYDGSEVRAVFTNSVGTATTDPATLTVNAGTTPPPPSGTNTETITATVPAAAGSFTWTVPANAAVTMTNATNQGSYLESTGQLQPVTVTDTRAGGPSWSISGQAGTFSDTTGDTVPGSDLGWTPSVAPGGTGGATAGAAVTSGYQSGNGLADAATLGSAADGHTLGSDSLGAGLDLQVPATTPAGTYTSTFTLTALS